MIVLDTNVLSELMRPVPNEAVKTWMLAVEDDLLVTTAVSVSEIVYGLGRLPEGRRRRDLERRFAELTGPSCEMSVLPFDDTAARLAGTLRSENEARGRPAGAADMMIAAIARLADAALATRNRKDFAGTGVTLIDPWAASARAAAKEGLPSTGAPRDK
jgi:predicted nucleic acid-binding protein